MDVPNNYVPSDFNFIHDNQVDALGPVSGDFNLVQQDFDTRGLDLMGWINDLQDSIRGLNVVESVVAGTNISVDATDPNNPIVNGTTGSGGGDVNSTSLIANNTVVRGDGGAKNIQQSVVLLDDVGNYDNVNSIKSNLTPTTETGASVFQWNPDRYTYDIDTGLGPVMCVGQETQKLVYNASGDEIEDGKVVHAVGSATAGLANIEKAIADTHEGFDLAVWVTTMTIPNNSIGIVTLQGDVNNIDTTDFIAGDTVWLSATEAGELVNVEPQFPNYVVQIGGIGVSSETEGVLVVSIKGTAKDTVTNFWNGVFRETFDFRVDSDGATITGTLTPSNGHPDMTMIFSDGFTMLDTEPGATITLIPGTDINPQQNFVYIPMSTKVLTLSTSSFPTTEHIKVADIAVRTAVTVKIRGALKNQNINALVLY